MTFWICIYFWRFLNFRNIKAIFNFKLSFSFYSYSFCTVFSCAINYVNNHYCPMILKFYKFLWEDFFTISHQVKVQVGMSCANLKMAIMIVAILQNGRSGHSWEWLLPPIGSHMRFWPTPKTVAFQKFHFAFYLWKFQLHTFRHYIQVDNQQKLQL